jgi:hypothetical protein
MKRIITAVAAIALLAGCTISGVATMAKYQAVKDGMTVSEVNAVMGFDGKEVSRSGTGENEFITITWANSSGANMTATFKAGKLMSRAQFGLQSI